MEKFSNFVSFIIGAGILQGVFLSAILFKIRRGNHRANRLLALLLLAFSANIAHIVLFSDSLSSTLTRTLKINEPFQLLLGPLMYLYIVQLTQPSFRFKKQVYLHFVPFVLYCLFILPLNSMHTESAFALYLKSNGSLVTALIWSTILLHITVYAMFSHTQLKRHRKNIRDCFSDVDRINLGWLRYFILVLLIVYAVYFSMLVGFVHASDQNSMFPHFQKGICLILSFAVYSLGYRGLTQPQIFIGISAGESLSEAVPAANAREEVHMPEASKYEHSSLDSNAAEDAVRTLMGFMEENKPYLNPELTLPELASMVDIQRNRLSQLLNEKLGVNFYDFVNGYRVKEVQKLMSDPKNQHMKVLALAFDAGFNSKATFNSIFKKLTGSTPSEYRKQLENTDSPGGFSQQL